MQRSTHTARQWAMARVGDPAPGFCGGFGEQDFRYDVAADAYHCLGEKVLRFLSQSDATHRRIYQAPTADCTGFALRERCTTPPRGRRISRSLDETYLERVRGYHETAAYAMAMRRRKVWVEPLFAEAKEWHGLRRFRSRGLEKTNSQAQLVARGQNLKRLLSDEGWGRRPWPCGAAGIVLPAAKSAARSSWQMGRLPNSVRPLRFVANRRPLFQQAGPFGR